MRRRLLLTSAAAVAAGTVTALGLLAVGGDDDGAQEASLARRAAESADPAPAPPPTPATTVAAPVTTTAAPPLAPLDARGAPVLADDPAGLASQIVAAERTLRDPATDEAEVSLAGHLQQAAYRKLAGRPEWDGEVLSRVPPDLVPAVEAHTFAARELGALVRRPQEKLPAWRIVKPPPLAELRAHYLEAEAAHGVPWQYLAAVHLTETRMSRLAGVSSAGAQGPMQFLPSTWAAYGTGNILDDRDAILGAANYLRANGGSCFPGQPCDLGRALYRYNPTPRYVNAVTVYAEQLRGDEDLLRGYYSWQVYYVTTLGDLWLREGYAATERRPVTSADFA